MAITAIQVGGIGIDDATALNKVEISDTRSYGVMSLVGGIMQHQSDNTHKLSDVALRTLNLEITATYQSPQLVSSDELDAMAHVLCGLRRSISDEDIDMSTYSTPVAYTWNTAESKIYVRPTAGIYADVVAPLAEKNIIIVGDQKRYIRFMDPEVKKALVAELHSRGICDNVGITEDEALLVTSSMNIF